MRRNTYSGKQYTNTKEDEALPVRVDIDEISKHYYILDNDGVNLELSRILTQYLEEMAGMNAKHELLETLQNLNKTKENIVAINIKLYGDIYGNNVVTRVKNNR